MRYIYEAICRPLSEGGFQVTFYDWDDCSASGGSYAEAIQRAAVVLEQQIGTLLGDKKALPEAVFGHKAPIAGTMVVISCDAVPSSIQLLLTASDASKILGVTRSRISNMLRAGILVEGHRDGRSTVITLDSVEERLSNPRQPGRPRREEAGPDSPSGKTDASRAGRVRTKKAE
jgi:predicted RNase H-like HicB family nuclease